MTFFVKSTVLQFWKKVKNPGTLNRVMRVRGPRGREGSAKGVIRGREGSEHNVS